MECAVDARLQMDISMAGRGDAIVHLAPVVPGRWADERARASQVLEVRGVLVPTGGAQRLLGAEAEVAALRVPW